MILSLTYDNFDNILAETGKIQVIEFYRKTCAHCKLLQKEMEVLSEEYDGNVVFGKVDIEEQPFILQKFSIMSVPTVMFFKNKEMKEKLTGYYPKIVIAENIKKLK